jgi:hypothetical protein
MEMLKKYSEVNNDDIPNFGKNTLRNFSILEMEKNIFDLNPKIIEYILSDKFIEEKKKELSGTYFLKRIMKLLIKLLKMMKLF